MLTYKSKDGSIVKPLSECDLNECMELKDTISRKYFALLGIGKGGSAQGFLPLINQIEERIVDIQAKMMKEIQEKKEESEKKREENENKPKDITSWTRGFFDKTSKSAARPRAADK